MNLSVQYWSSPSQNPHTQYDTSRLKYSVREDTCGLTINSPHANDTGDWICQVTDNSPNTEPVTMRGTVRVFTAQKSVINVTRPNMRANPTYSIYADFGNRINYDLETLECNPGCETDDNCPFNKPTCSGHTCIHVDVNGIVNITVSTESCSLCEGSGNPLGYVRIKLAKFNVYY